MCKKLFIFVSLFVLLFGFNINVKAVEKPKYIFKTSDFSKNSFFYSVCVNSFNSFNSNYANTAVKGIGGNSFPCVLHSNKGWENHDMFSFNFDAGKYDSFGFSGINSIADNNNGFGLKQHLMAMTCSGDINCFKYTLNNICNNNGSVSLYSDDGDVCKKLDGENGNVEVIEYANGKKKYTCTSDFKSVGKKNSSSFSLKISYDEAIPEFSVGDAANSGTWLEKGKTYIESTNQSDVFNRFYLYSKGGSYDEFKQYFVEQLVNGNCSSTMGALCLGKQSVDGKKLYWYFEESSEMCTSENGYIEGVTQEMGDDADNSNIEYNDLKTKIENYASKLLGEKKIATFDSCEDLLSGDGNDSTIIDVLKVVVNIIKFVVPIIFIVMGSIDFIQAIFAQDDGGMKKAQGKFIKRLIIAVVVFLIPYALRLVLTIANSIWPFISPDFCGVL